jgi:hypothetical protein
MHGRKSDRETEAFLPPSKNPKAMKPDQYCICSILGKGRMPKPCVYLHGFGIRDIHWTDAVHPHCEQDDKTFHPELKREENKL